MSPNNGDGRKLIHESVHEVNITLAWSIISTLHLPVPARTILPHVNPALNIQTRRIGLSNCDNWKLIGQSYGKLQ